MSKDVKISSVHAGLFKLDGGAMFGVVPKKLWKRLMPSDENSMCTWAMRCLLLETGQSKILVDTGMGTKQGEKFRSHFEPHGDMDLMSSLESVSIQPEEITDVFLTHLHFDHCGGAVMKDDDGQLLPTFPNATYWTNESHYNWALEPNARERASFLKENFVPLLDHGKLRFLDSPKHSLEWLESPWSENILFSKVNGHTEAMMPLKIKSEGKTYIYPADLLPSHAHVGMPYVMAYDIRPLTTLEEKKKFYSQAEEENYHIIFEHDATHEGCTLKKDDRGRTVIDQFIQLTH